MKATIILCALVIVCRLSYAQVEENHLTLKLDKEHQESEGYITDVFEKDGKTIVAIDHITYKEVEGHFEKYGIHKYQPFNESRDVFYYIVKDKYFDCESALELSFEKILEEKTIKPNAIFYFESTDGIIDELYINDCND